MVFRLFDVVLGLGGSSGCFEDDGGASVAGWRVGGLWTPCGSTGPAVGKGNRGRGRGSSSDRLPDRVKCGRATRRPTTTSSFRIQHTAGQLSAPVGCVCSHLYLQSHVHDLGFLVAGDITTPSGNSIYSSLYLRSTTFSSLSGLYSPSGLHQTRNLGLGMDHQTSNK